MNRRDFIKAALAVPAIAALPAPQAAAEELLDGITYFSQSYMGVDLGFGDTVVVETWRKAGGKIWHTLATEDKILSLTEMPYAPFVLRPRFDYGSAPRYFTTQERNDG